MNHSFELRDEFNRRPVAEKIIQLLTSNIQLSPMIIDGVWGSGKTEFTIKLIDLLDSGDSGLNAIYLDAFRSEHANNPILSLLASIVKSLPQTEQPSTIKRIAPTLNIIGKTLGKAAVNWALKQDATAIAGDYEEQIKEVSDSLIDHTAEKMLESFVKEEEDLKALQSILEKLTEEKPLVIFIDELDRCRPDYAVSMLESIKHVFDIDELQFVLVTNTEQLKATINHTYGVGVDAQRYLDKFISFKVTLPTQVKEGIDLEDNSVNHFRQLITESGILNQTTLKNLTHGHVWTLGYLIKTHDRSLREVETLIRYLEIYHTLCEGLKDNTVFGYSLFRVIGIYLYTFETKLADDIVAQKFDGNELLRLFGVSEIDELDSEKFEHDLNLVRDVLLMLGRECQTKYEQFIDKNKDSQVFYQLKRNYFKAGFPPDKILSLVEESISELRMKPR